MRINFNDKSVEISKVKECNWFNKIKGLMFSRREKANILLFAFDKPTKMAIHSFFVFFPFIAVWLDSKNKVIEMKVVKSFSPLVSCKKYYYKLVEIPINLQYSKIVKFLVGKRKVYKECHL